MKVTQIFFDWIQADGRNWAAVIDHSTGARSFHSLRGVTSGRRPLRRRRAALDHVAAGASGNVNTSEGLAMSAGLSHEAVMCAQNADRR
jgi:hypothetical protein